MSLPLQAADFDLLSETSSRPRVVVANKADLQAAWSSADLRIGARAVSSKTGEGLDDLQRGMRSVLEGVNPSIQGDSAAVTNVRHAALLDRARQSLRRACEAVENPAGPVAEEFVLSDLQDARAALEEVTGKRTSEDVLRHIFSRFCIGK
jgi:tRNA modification GTPase